MHQELVYQGATARQADLQREAAAARLAASMRCARRRARSGRPATTACSAAAGA